MWSKRTTAAFAGPQYTRLSPLADVDGRRACATGGGAGSAIPHRVLSDNLIPYVADPRAIEGRPEFAILHYTPFDWRGL